MPWTRSSEGWVWVDTAGRPASAPADAPPPPNRDSIALTNGAIQPPPEEPLSEGLAPQSQTRGQQIGGAVNQGLLSLYRALNPLVGAGHMIREGPNVDQMLRQWWNTPTGPAPTAATTTETEPLFTSGDELQLSPVEQRLMDMLNQATASQAPSTRPSVDEVPEIGVDPRAAAEAQIATERRGRFEGLLAEALAGMQAEREAHRNRSNMQQFGEWLSRVAAGRDLSQAGVVLQDMRQRTRELERAWIGDAIRLTEAGFSLDEAVTRATANVAAATQRTDEANAERRFEYRTESADRADLARARESQNLFSSIPIVSDILNQAMARDAQATQALAGIPGYESAAAGRMATQLFPGNERAAAALGTGLARRQHVANIIARAQVDRRDVRQVRRAVRRVDPSITDEEIREVLMQAQVAQ